MICNTSQINIPMNYYNMYCNIIIYVWIHYWMRLMLNRYWRQCNRAQNKQRKFYSFIHFLFIWAVVKLNLPFVNKFMPEPVHFFVVSGRCGTAISRHNLETLVQSSNGQFKVQSFTEWYLHWKVTPRMHVLVIFAMVEIHADWKTAIPVEREVNRLILGLKDNTFADFNPLLKLSLIRIWC